MPVFKYLESKDIDEVGYTLRTASLMTDPEYFFDETNPGDYPLFGIGYVIVPANRDATGGGATRWAAPADYCLWSLPDSGYIHVYDTTGVLTRHPGRRRLAERDALGVPASRASSGT